MAKSRNKKKRDDAVSMDVSDTKSVSESAPQAMDTSETGDAKLAARTRNLTSVKKGKPMKRAKNARKMKALAKAIAKNDNTSVKKGQPMKRTKNARKMKAVAKAIAKNDKDEEKASKNVSKQQRTLSAKILYE